MESFVRDARFGLRLLWKDRGFTATALLTLAVCIGANAAIFAIVNSVLLKPLPIPESDRLVLLYNSYPRAGVERASNAVPDYYDRLREVDVFSEQALYNTRGMTIGLDGQPQRVLGMLARPSLLRMLYARPALGRIFHESEGEPGEDRKVVLTWTLWQQLYGGAPDALGKELRVNGVPHTIVGVLPESFHFLDPDIRLWVPLSFTPEDRSDDRRHSNNWSMLGRLKPGATIEQAQQQIDALNARNMERFPHFREILTNAGFHTVATPLQEDLVRGIRGTLYLLWGGVLFVLLIGAVNLTNLVLVRSSARMKELATRHALGAALTTLMRQLVTETVILTVIGGAAGLALGSVGLDLLAGGGLDQLPRGSEVRIDPAVVGFTALLALAVGLLVGLVPVLHLRRMNLSQAFREESRSGTSGRAARSIRRALVASQVAFAFMLLIGAGLLLASFQRVLSIDVGFNPANVLTARVAPPESRYADAAALRSFADRFLAEVRSLPGVLHAGITSSVPFGEDFSDSVILAEGYQMAPGESLISPYRIQVTPGYFEAMEIPLRSGRYFTAGDTHDAPRVIIVDEKLARHFWGDADPVGRRMFQPDNAEDLTKPGPNARWYTVVGVVEEIRLSGFVGTDDRVGAYYFPYAQQPSRYATLTVKTGGDPDSLAPSIRRQLLTVDPELPLYSVMSMERRMDATLVDRRTPMLLAVIFGAVALFLAAVGIYGVLAYQVSQRRRELGIRLALGSDTTAIFQLVLREGLALLGVGVAAGLAGAFAMRRVMESQLYGTSAMDPVVLAGVGLLLGIVVLAACAVPARRAAKIDPLVALSEA